MIPLPIPLLPHLVAVLLAQPAPVVPQSDPCFTGAKNTLEINDCLAGQLGDERKRLGRYLGAVRRGIGKDTATLRQLDRAQRVWETFVTQDCDAVYSHWRGGSIRNAKSLLCSIDAVALRTHDLWARYLTYEDSTPPVLPEPRRGALSPAERRVPIDTSATSARLTWRRIPAHDALSPAAARRQLPKDIAWAPAPQTWDILPSVYASDGRAKGPFKLATMHDESASPITASLKNVSPNGVTVSLTRKRSGVAFYARTFVVDAERSITHIAVFNDGANVVELTRVICGDRDRFDVRISAGNDDSEPVGECSASAAVSPDGRYVLLESGIVDRNAHELRKFPNGFPMFDQVIGWSKDGKRVALNATSGLILVTRTY